MKMTIFIILCLIAFFGVENLESNQRNPIMIFSKLKTPTNKLSDQRNLAEDFNSHEVKVIMIKVKCYCSMHIAF